MDKREDFRKRLMATFRVEAQDYVAAISSGLVALEKAPPAERPSGIETVYRAAHSLKGAARTVNLAPLELACHGFEDVFAEWKRHSDLPSLEVFDNLLRASDLLEQLLKASVDGTPAERLFELQRGIEQLLTGQLGAPPPSGDGPSMPPALAVPPPPLFTAGTPADRPVPPPRGSGMFPPVAVDRSVPAAWPREEGRPGPAPSTSDPPGVPLEASKLRQARPGDSGATSGWVRVNTEKLDTMLLKVEELLSIKQGSDLLTAQIKDTFLRLEDWKRAFKRRRIRKANRAPVESLGPEPVTGARESLSHLEAFASRIEADMTALRLTAVQNQRLAHAQIDSLMEDFKELLLQPFSTLLEGLPRMVRDLARDLGKDADLVTCGGEIEMDRRILEEMRDPLVHMLRNCLDHGVENPGERLQAGKKPCARIAITVEPRGGHRVEITVADDGAGLHTAQIKAAAVRNGLLAASEAEALTDEAAHRLIFHSGLSTSAIITGLSGRGLGMAIVRERIEKLGGGVSVETRSGQGTLFRILLPTARATFRGVLVRVREQHFVFPTRHIDRVIRIKTAEIRAPEGRAAISLDGRLTALVRLADVLGLEPDPGRNPPPLAQPAVVLNCGGKTVACLVDAVLNEHEILLKNLGPQLRRVRNFEGATVLPGGKLAPVLNVFDLFKSALEAAASPLSQGERPTAAEAPVSKRILVVEDSITSRTLLKNILEAAHYEVETAVDGLDGFTKLRDGRFALVVSDVEMPRLHGFDLTRRIRHDPQLAATPVVLVTARESREDREHGIEVGANAYLVKSSFDQTNLIEVIRRLL